MFGGCNEWSVISFTECASCPDFSTLATGVIELVIKCNLGNGTKFVWNSFKSTFNSPSNHNEAGLTQ